MLITGTTRVVGIFGDPVAHSPSPLMQNAALRAAGIDAVYVPFHVTAAHLRDAICAIRPMGLANRTVQRAKNLLADLAPKLAGTAFAVLPFGAELAECLENGSICWSTVRPSA